MSTTWWILIAVLLVIVAAVLAFAIARKKQRTGSVLAAPARGDRSGRGS